MGGKGSGGKNKKPSAIRKVEGNAGHRPLNDLEPEPEPRDPPMPEDLGAKAQKVWNRLLPILRGMKVLTVADGDALGALCTARVRWRQAEDMIDRMGPLIYEEHETLDGNIEIKIKKNPAVTVAADSFKQMTALLAAFGLTPASRSGIKTNGNGESQDPLDDLFSGKAAGDIVQ